MSILFVPKSVALVARRNVEGGHDGQPRRSGEGVRESRRCTRWGKFSRVYEIA